MTIRGAVSLGAMSGLRAFIAFGVVEALSADLLPWFLGRTTVLEWQTTTILLAIYASAGLILGATAGLLLHIQAAGILVVVAPYALNVIRDRPFSFMAVPLSAAALACCIALAGARPGAWQGRVRPFTNCWCIAFLLVGLPAVSKELLWDQPNPVRACGAAAFLVLLATVAYLVRNIRFPSAGVAALAVLTPTLCFILDQPLQVPGGQALGPSPASGKPNVVLLVLDTVRADHLSLYGYCRDTTPHLKSLAEQATVYTNATSASDMTLASHASIFTGMYPSWHGTHYTLGNPLGRPLDRRLRTLAETLGENGYVTMGVAANSANLQHVYALDRGFSYWSVRPGFFFEKDAFYLREGVRCLLAPLILPHFGMSYRRAEHINRDVFQLLDSVKQSKRPFLLFVNYMDAHWPYNPPPPFDSLYPGRDPQFGNAQYSRLLREVATLHRQVAEHERRHLLSQYDGGIAYLDSQIGELVNRLKALRLYENTLLIVTADHGEAFGERSLMGHGTSVYQDQIHVPLIVKYPNSNRAAVSSRLVSGVDLMPTVLDVTGFIQPDGLQGESLFNPRAASRHIIAESFPSLSFYRWHPRFHRVERAILEGSRKLVTSTAGQCELYDLAGDPNELKNLAALETTTAADLQTTLDRSLQTAVAQSRKMPEIGLGKGDIDRLKSLGYVQ